MLIVILMGKMLKMQNTLISHIDLNDFLLKFWSGSPVKWSGSPVKWLGSPVKWLGSPVCQLVNRGTIRNNNRRFVIRIQSAVSYIYCAADGF